MKRKGLKIEERGRVTAVSNPLIKIEGLPLAKTGEILEIGGKKAMVFQFGKQFNKDYLIYQDIVYALLLEKEEEIKAGEEVRPLSDIFRVPVGKELLGRVLNPLGRDIETGAEIETKEKRKIERKPPEIMERERIQKPLETGIKVIDALFPIGRGQRELIVGDRKTGKTSLALDAILNQKDVICFYVSIGQKKPEILEILNTLIKRNVLGHTVVVAAFSSDSPVLQYLAPFSAMTMAEWFRDQGEDVLIVFDDLTKHAWAWRQLCLLAGRPPGREAYPGDIFYLHARLLERAAKMNKEAGGGSITALPICQTKGGDISEYIPTNLISITDGQLYLETNLFQKGMRPAVNIGLSVSRIGSQAQRNYLKEVVSGLKLILSQHQELKRLVQLETKISPQAQKNYKRGEILLEIFKQEKHKSVDTINQALIYYAVLNGFLDNLKIEKVKGFEEKFYQSIDYIYPRIKKEIQEKGWNDKTKEKIKNIIEKFSKEFFA